LKIFVTGKNGFIGLNLTNSVQRKGMKVVCSQTNENKHKIDILKKDHLFDIKENIDVIVHLAAKTSITNSINDPYDTYYTNILGTLNVLEFAKARNIKKIINLSTYVYGKPLYLPIDENHPLNPHTPYNKSKIVSENLCKYYSQDYGISIVTLRPFYIYGPFSNPFSFIPSILKQIKNNGKVFLSNQNTKRDFLFIDDFISLVLKIIDSFPKGYNIYNVGYGKSNSLEEIIRIIEKILTKEICIIYDKSIRPNDIDNMFANITKVTKSFSWKPQIDIEEGIPLSLKKIMD
jgi:nucleoside-diphosphate-sugar epimerase